MLEEWCSCDEKEELISGLVENENGRNNEKKEWGIGGKVCKDIITGRIDSEVRWYPHEPRGRPQIIEHHCWRKR